MGGTPIPDSIKSVYESDRVHGGSGREVFSFSLARRRLLNLIKTVCRPKRCAWPGTKVDSLSLTIFAYIIYVRKHTHTHTREHILSSQVNILLYRAWSLLLYNYILSPFSLRHIIYIYLYYMSVNTHVHKIQILKFSYNPFTHKRARLHGVYIFLHVWISSSSYSANFSLISGHGQY